MGIIELQELSHFDSKQERWLSKGQSVAQCQHSDFTIFLTLSKQM